MTTIRGTAQSLRPFKTPLSPDWGAATFVWGIWGLMLLAALGFVCLFASGTVPFADDWHFVAALCGYRSLRDFNWLWWEQNGVHRNPLPKFVYILIYKILSNLNIYKHDFRVAMFANIIAVGALAFAMIWIAKGLRGRLHYSDAFFPLVLLNWGHYENYLQGALNVYFIPLCITGTLILIIALNGTRLMLGDTVLAGICLVLLPLCGGIGLVYVPPLALWLGFAGVLRWRSGNPDARRDGALMLIFTFGALLLTGLYFVDFERPHNPPVAGPGALLKTGVQFLAMGLGPAAMWSWPFSGLVVLGLLVMSTATLVLVLRRQPRERTRALGFLMFLGGTVLSASALSLRSAGQDDDLGWEVGFLPRYITLAAPALCCIYYIWVVYSQPTPGCFIQACLFSLMCAVLPINTWEGFENGRGTRRQTNALERDLLAGKPKYALLSRYTPDFFYGYTERLDWLRDAGVGYFRFMRKDPAFREISLPAAQPADLHRMSEGDTAPSGRKKSCIIIALPQPGFIAGIRIKFNYSYNDPMCDARLKHLKVCWKRIDQTGFPESTYIGPWIPVTHGNPRGPFDVGGQCYHSFEGAGARERTATIWVGDTIDRFCIDPDVDYDFFKISDIVLLVPATGGDPAPSRSGIRPAERPDLATSPLDSGIRPESNTCSGEPGEVADDEVNAHLGNLGLLNRSP